MFKVLTGTIRGCLSLTLYALNTVFWCLCLFMMAGVKALIPMESLRRGCNRILNTIAENWIWVNNLNQKLTGGTRWDIRGVEALERSDWYLVIANHQSWVDILVLQRIFYRKIPFLKFFIKKELFWFPILGMAWWALDFPFIKRYSKRLLQKKPHLRGKDLEITRKACAKFKKIPISVMNFVEGTRFTDEKHSIQQSPYTHLLKPKAGGTGFVLGAMENQIRQILDVTIAYPGGTLSFWAFLCGNIREIKVNVQPVPVGPELIGDYANDGIFRKKLQRWLNNLWVEKDQCIAKMMHS
jgi:1-acyl-sn-glycerol-3-phosphate acyltransferase